MNAYVLAAGVLLGIIGFVLGSMLGTRNFALWRISVFQDLDHLVGMIENISALTHDRNISPAVVIDRLQEIKYGLGVPERDEWRYDDHPAQ